MRTPGVFEDLRRRDLADGELIEFTLTWQENGVTHMCHQAHILRLRDGQISSKHHVLRGTLAGAAHRRDGCCLQPSRLRNRSLGRLEEVSGLTIRGARDVGEGRTWIT